MVKIAFFLLGIFQINQNMIIIIIIKPKARQMGKANILEFVK